LNSTRRLVMLNQMAGPLFRQLAEGMAEIYPDGVKLVTGHPDALVCSSKVNQKLQVVTAVPYNRRSYFHRFFSWIRYLLNASGNILFAKKGDVFLLASNPPLLAPWIWLLCFIKPVRYAVLIYDIYPDVLEELKILDRHSFVARSWRALNRKVYRRAKVLITIGYRMASRMERQFGIPVEVVHPWVDIHKIIPIARDKNPHATKFINQDDFVVLYSGNLGASHDIDSILSAAEILRPHKTIRFIFFGDGEKRNAVESYIQRFPNQNVRLFPFQPEGLLSYTLSLADVSLVTLDKGMEDLMVPSKFFSYLAAGSAILGIAHDNSELSNLIDSQGCGIRVPPGCPDKLAKILLMMSKDTKVLNNFKRQARVLAELKYAKEVGVKSFKKIIASQLA